MTGQEQPTGGLLMAGLDGANPLAFLAALGVLRGLTLTWPDRPGQPLLDTAGYLTSQAAHRRRPTR